MVALEAMSQADFDAPSWTPAGRDGAHGRFMRIRPYHCFMHENDIRDALGHRRADPADLRSAMDEVATGLGYIVGRRPHFQRAAGTDRSDRAGRLHVPGPGRRPGPVVDHFDEIRPLASRCLSVSSCG